MKILAISDTHGRLPKIEPCDLLLVGGDVCPDLGVVTQLSWLDTNFRAWLEQLPAKKIIGIAGNHDFVFEERRDAVVKLKLPWTYLEGHGYIHEGLHIHGTPWVPNLPRWAFHLDALGLTRRSLFLSPDIDILLSHGPPYGYCDFVAPQFGSCHVGDPDLASAIDYIKPRAVVCGHIHEGRGVEHTLGGVPVYNVSHVDENYEVSGGAVEIPL